MWLVSLVFFITIFASLLCFTFGLHNIRIECVLNMHQCDRHIDFGASSYHQIIFSLNMGFFCIHLFWAITFSVKPHRCVPITNGLKKNQMCLCMCVCFVRQKLSLCHVSPPNGWIINNKDLAGIIFIPTNANWCFAPYLSFDLMLFVAYREWSDEIANSTVDFVLICPTCIAQHIKIRERYEEPFRFFTPCKR